MNALRLAPALAALVLTLASSVRAQGQPEVSLLERQVGTRLINLPTTTPTPRSFLEVFFSHRFEQRVDDRGAETLFGLDGGADIGLGVAAGLGVDTEIALYRSSFNRTFEVSAKHRLLDQTAAVPISLAVRAGIDLVALEGVEDDSRPFLQVLVARRLGDRVLLLSAPSWAADTARLENVFNIPVGAALAIGRNSAIEVELTLEIDDDPRAEPQWAIAWSHYLRGHIFEVLLTNSRATTVDQSLAGDFGGGFESGDIRLGFNIVRLFRYSRD